MPTTAIEISGDVTSRRRVGTRATQRLALLVVTLLVATPAVADVSIQSKSASLAADGTDFFVFPGHQVVINAPDATSFTNTAEVAFGGHGSVQLDVKTSQDSHVEVSGDDLTLTTTQAFSILHTADDDDRQNLVSHTGSGLTINFCTTKKSSFLFTASGHMEVPPDACPAKNCKKFKTKFADAFVLGTFTCNGCPQVAFKQFAIGVNVSAVNGVAVPPSGTTQGSGTIPPGCYELSTLMDAHLNSPLLCKTATGVCEPLQIPPDVNNNPPSATGSFTLTLNVTPATSTNDDEITWVGPSTGAFGDPNNWSPQKVPTITPDESDTAIFAGGSTLTVDVSAAAAAALFRPRAAGTRATGRLHMKGTRNLVVNDFQLLQLDDTSLDKASLVVGNNGELHIEGGGVVAHNARIGLNGAGTVTVADPDALFTADRLLVGEDGDGLLHILGGASGVVTDARLGNGHGVGRVTVEGLNTTFTTGTLSVGNTGPAELLVKDGGAATSTDAFVDANLPSAPIPEDGPALNRCGGRSGGAGVEVTGRNGTSSAWHVDTLSIGGLGCVEASFQGGIVTGENGLGDVHVGTSTPGEAVMFVNTGAVLSVHGDLIVGDQGSGRVQLDENHALDPRINVTGALLIGESPRGNGKVFVEGDVQTDGASLNSNTVRVGEGTHGKGLLLIRNGARVATTTTAEVGTDSTASNLGFGFVSLIGPTGSGVGSESLTRWSIGESLTIGGSQLNGGNPPGVLTLFDAATVAVGTAPAHGTITIRPGGLVQSFGSAGFLLTNGGTIRNDGVIAGAVTIVGSYDSASSGQLVQGNGSAPPQVISALSASSTALLGTAPANDGTPDASARATKSPPPPSGPIVIIGDADFTNTTLVLQFTNGFAPHQGDQLPVVEVQGQVTGGFAATKIVGLAPGASFDVNLQTGVATSLTDTVALPVVTMKAPAKLKESAKKGAKIKFTRTGPTTDPLTISYAATGTAEEGFDYGPLPGTITFPAKKKSATLVIVPFADGLREPPESIELTVLPGDDYAPGLTPTSTITLLSIEKKPKK